MIDKETLLVERPDDAKALVVRNPKGEPVTATANMKTKGKRLVLWRPDTGEQTLDSLPLKIKLQSYEAIVLLALD